jgi:hypothetical protein
MNEWRQIRGSGSESLLLYGNPQVAAIGNQDIWRLAVADRNFRILIDLGNQPGWLRVMDNGVPRGTLPYGADTGLSGYSDGGFLVDYPMIGRILRFSANGTVVFAIEGAGDARPFSAEEKHWFRAAHATGPSQIQDADKLLPEHLPWFGSVKADDQGRIWVSHYRTNREQMEIEEAAIYDLYSSDGIWIGRQAMPVSLAIIQSGYGYNETGLIKEIPRVERWRLIPLVPEVGW